MLRKRFPMVRKILRGVGYLCNWMIYTAIWMFLLGYLPISTIARVILAIILGLFASYCFFGLIRDDR